MAPILYGNALFTCTRRVLLTAAELGQDIELVTIDTRKGEHKTPEYLKIHPWGRIPSLKEGDFTMFESRAIARYLALGRYPEQGNKLVPSPVSDPEGYARFEQAAGVELSYIDPSLSALVQEKLFVPELGGVADESKVANLRKELASNLDVLDQILSNRTYVAGNEFTLADMFYIPYLFMLAPSGEGDLISYQSLVG